MDELLRRFLRYVRIDTTADPASTTYPSSAGQLKLGALLASELSLLGLEEVIHLRSGVVMALLPGNRDEAPAIAWFGHLDTTPEAPARDVRPTVHSPYRGGAIHLPGDPDHPLRPGDTKDLEKMAGRTLITSDGSTSLGADDKAGLAVIVTALERLIADPGLPRGPIRVVLTCDEELGEGVDAVDAEGLGVAAAYTVDGGGEGAIEYETFSADLAEVTITGRSAHAGFAKGRMVNAVRLAALFLSRLPWRRLAPETSARRDGFLHPYDVAAVVAEARIRIQLRSFLTEDLAGQAEIVRGVASTIEADHPDAKVGVEVATQYRNMGETLIGDPRALGLAIEAVENVGLEPRLESLRGGTDGAKLCDRGLPAPNLFAGMHAIHSNHEYACLEEMNIAADALVQIARLWGEEKRDPNPP